MNNNYIEYSNIQKVIDFFNDINEEIVRLFVEAIKEGVKENKKETEIFSIKKEPTTIEYSFVLLRSSWLDILTKMTKICKENEFYEYMNEINKLSQILKKEKNETVLSSKNSNRNRRFKNRKN